MHYKRMMETPMTAITLAEPSPRSLLLQMSVNKNPLGMGTGFVVQSPRGPVLITCRHNLSGRHQQTGQPLSSTGGIPDTVNIMHHVQNQLGHWTPVPEALYDGG
jgi:hypothetical protein